MAVSFTKSQRTAIDIHGRTLLISAAAGSGKTATLTERIIRELTDPECPRDISDMLIVTFTRAAAGELRTRISAALSAELALNPSDAHLSRQLIAVGSARICTIDSFYLDVVRENFQRLGLPASFRLADDSELAPLRSDCMQNIIELFYDTEPEFPPLAESLTTARGDARLAEILITDVIPRLECLPRGMYVPADDAELLEQEARRPFFESRAGKSALDSIFDTLDDASRTMSAAVEEISADPIYPEGYIRAFRYDLDTVNALLDAARDPDSEKMRRLLADYSPLRLPSFKKGTKPERAEELAAIRNGCKKSIGDIQSKYFSMSNDEISETQLRTASLLRTLSRLLVSYRDAFREEKNARSICEFSDIRGYAYSLLIDADGNPTPTAMQWRERFSEIFVDEYQDTDPVQDAIFRAVSRGDNLFMVGDIKQSIYSFRGAEPSIFAGYRKSFAPLTPGEEPEDNAPHSVFMSENFRCSENIVNFTNAVSAHLFSASEDSPQAHGIGYRPEDDLIFSRKYDPDVQVPDEKVEITLIEPNAGNDADEEKDDEPTKDDPEISYVCSRIAGMLSSGRDPGDIAVLSRSKKHAAKIAERLSSLGIPAANSVGEDLFANPEVLMFVSILSAIDNPQRDIPLAGALKSPVFGFTLADLVRIRGGNTDISLFDSVTSYSAEGQDSLLADKCSKALARLDSWRSYAEAMPVDRLMRRVWHETSALTYAGADPEQSKRHSSERRANLQRLYEYARRFEVSAFKGLSEFVSYINGMISEGIKIESDASSARGAVSIMTVHKSKGLEFPVVFLVGFGASFNRRDAGENLVFSPEAGMALRLPGDDGISKLDTPMRRAAAYSASALSDEEEIRILYVALTRARDKLIITAKTGKRGSEGLLSDAQTRATRGGRASVIGAPNRISWILTSLATGRGAGSYVINTLSSKEATSESVGVELPEACVESAVSDEIEAKLRERFDFTYPYAYLHSVPAKLSVSRLYPGVLDDEETLNTDELLKRADASASRIPSFMADKHDESISGANLAAERGTATHLFLQFCDFSRLDGTQAAIDEEASRLLALGFISEREAELLRRDELVAFSRSDLFGEVRQATGIHREQRFNVMLPAAQFASDIELSSKLKDERVLVQGVMDLFYTDSAGKLVLCDYKTDRLSDKEKRNPELAAAKLISAHREQLAYYCSALELITGKRPDRVLIYSLCLGDTVEVPFDT